MDKKENISNEYKLHNEVATAPGPPSSIVDGHKES